MINIRDIIDNFETLYENHPNINSFGYGQQYDINGFRFNYPYMWIINDVPHTLIYSEDNKYQSIEYNFVIRIGDKLNDQINVLNSNGQSSNNGMDIISDTFRIMLDILNSIMMNSSGLFSELDLVNDIDIEPFFNEDTGDVNGHEATITLRVKNDFKCQSPLTTG
jgi:hypothetical protein